MHMLSHVQGVGILHACGHIESMFARANDWLHGANVSHTLFRAHVRQNSKHLSPKLIVARLAVRHQLVLCGDVVALLNQADATTSEGRQRICPGCEVPVQISLHNLLCTAVLLTWKGP